MFKYIDRAAELVVGTLYLFNSFMLKILSRREVAATL